ncbi:TPA: tail fiber domain-containing protein, partial [Shigella sonnei]
MSDIFSGRELSVQYNADIGNRTPQGAGNVVIKQINTFPTLTINSEANNFETYDSDYRTVLLSDKSVAPFDIVVNYLPDDPTHQFLDNAAKSQQLFQIIIQYQMNKDENTITYAMVNGYITSYKLDGDKGSVVTKAYSFAPHDVIARAMTINALSPIYQGDYGLGSNTTDVPQYSPSVPTGNSFIKVPSSQAGNPAGADLMGVGLVDGTTVSSLAMTKTGTLSIYAKNATTAWTRIYTATQMDGRYVPLTRTINGHALTANLVLNSEDTGSVPDTRTVNGKPLSEDVVLTSTDTGSVPDTRTVNGHVLSEDIVLSSEDTGSVPDTRTVNGHVLSENVVLSSEDTGSVPDTRMVNGHVLSEDVVLTSTDVGLGKVTDDAQLTIAGNLSDLGDVEEARINLAVYSMDEVDAEVTALADSITSLDSASMKKASNLSDLSSLSTARTNLQVNRLTQGATYTDLMSNDLTNRIRIQDNGAWGASTGTGWIALGIGQGGTGATDALSARLNFQVDRFNQGSNLTTIKSADSSAALVVYDGGQWGSATYIAGAFTGWKALAIPQGGTGVKTQAELWPAIRPTGATSLAGDPVSDSDATTKRWVENLLSSRTSVSPQWDVIASSPSSTAIGSYVTGGRIRSICNIGTSTEISGGFRVGKTMGQTGQADLTLFISENGAEDKLWGLKGPTGTILTDVQSGWMTNTAVSGPTDANTITFNGMYAGPGDSGINYSEKYSPLLHMQRYPGANRSQLQIDGGGTLRVRGGNGTTWFGWLVMQAQGTSGREFKRDITPANPVEALDRIMSQDLVTFIYKDDEQERVRFGVIAEDAELTAPQYIKHDEETVEIEGEIVTRDHPRVDLNPIVMDLMGAIQAQQEEINQL